MRKKRHNYSFEEEDSFCLSSRTLLSSVEIPFFVIGFMTNPLIPQPFAKSSLTKLL